MELDYVPDLDFGHVPRFDLLSPMDVENLPDLAWLVPGILPKPCLAVLYGEPGSYKTFAALSIALSVAHGGEWLGRQLEQVNVLYIAAEGVFGLKLRVCAHRKINGITEDSVKFLASAIDIVDGEQIEALSEDLKMAGYMPGLIVVDTLARVTVGYDENNAKDMGRAVAGLDELKRWTEAAVLVIHHTTKNGGSERGSSALRGAADVMIQCEKSESSDDLAVTLKCAKMKDAEPFNNISAELIRVELENGKSSLVVGKEVEISDSISRVNEDRIIEILANAFTTTGATNSELRMEFESAGYGKKSTFDRALRKLQNSDRMRIEGDGRGKKYFPICVSVKSVS